MSDDRLLADLATRQLRDTYAQYIGASGAVRQSEHIYSYVTGFRAALANGCVVAGPATADELRQALDWVSDRTDLYLVTIDDRFAEPLTQVLAERGIGTDEPPAPGMALDPIGDMPSAPQDIDIVPVDATNYEAWVSITGEIFLPVDVARQIFPPALILSATIRSFLARVEGEYVGTATAVLAGDLAGIYSVGTLAKARGRGVGRATTAAAIQAAAQDWGVQRIFLQSTEMGRPVYEALGFRTVVGYHMLPASLPPH